ncbi:MAG: transposase [Pyrinomonadaceae bacterium]|nr:transposase [Pyrinomonadaceae bacterium]MBP6213226.1 transposase [Pyrinomonadaceae bacterium]
MPQSLVKIIVHMVWSTKDRVRLIPIDIETRLYGYISAIISNNGGPMIIAGGDADHIHILVSLGKADMIKLIGDIKRETSKWMKEIGVHKFYWQRGYGAFSVGQSQVAAVSGYIRDQKEHHKKQVFEDEFRSLCRKYDVEIDERYCWD